MSRKKIGRIFNRIFNAVMILGMVIPALYFLYHFIIKVMDNLDIKYAFVDAVFSAWHSMSGLFLKMAFLTSIFIGIKLLSLIPSLLGRIRIYHKGTDVKEVQLVDNIEVLKTMTTDSFVELYKSVMYDPEKTAALLPVFLYSVATDNEDSYDIMSFIFNFDSDADDTKHEFENIKKSINGKSHIALSYFTCTSPENGYELVGAPVTRVKTPSDSSDEKDEKTLYIACSGSGSYRPIKLRALNYKAVKKSKNTIINSFKPDDDIWVFDEISSSLVNVKNK